MLPLLSISIPKVSDVASPYFDTKLSYVSCLYPSFRDNLYSKLYNLSNCQSIKLFKVSNIPNAHTRIIVHPKIPAMPMKVLILFLNTSLKFHLVENFIFLNIPFEVIFKLLDFTFGNFSLNVSAGDSLSSLLHVKYVTNDIRITTPIATNILLLENAAVPFGIWK